MLVLIFFYRENKTGIIKSILFKPKKKKTGGQESNPGSRVLISTAAVKMLIACAMQAIASQIIQIDVMSCTDTIKYIFFLSFLENIVKFSK